MILETVPEKTHLQVVALLWQKSSDSVETILRLSSSRSPGAVLTSINPELPGSQLSYLISLLAHLKFSIVLELLP
jgi:hypothetical protein